MLLRATYLISQSLRCDDSNFVTYSLIGLEVESELWIVSLDDDLGRFLDCLCSYATHLGELYLTGRMDVEVWVSRDRFSNGANRMWEGATAKILGHVRSLSVFWCLAAYSRRSGQKPNIRNVQVIYFTSYWIHLSSSRDLTQFTYQILTRIIQCHSPWSRCRGT